jgi:co-chaperonin GroES (HSP10)
MQEIANKIEYLYDSIDEAFPAADPGVEPFGSRVLVQIRTPKTKTRGGIIVIAEARETEHYNTQVAKVIKVGPLAFKNRNTLEYWPEGHWCNEGDFVRVPKYGGDRWTVKTGQKTDGVDDEAVMVIFNDLDLVGKYTGDPLAVKAFL